MVPPLRPQGRLTAQPPAGGGPSAGPRCSGSTGASAGGG